MNGPMDSYLYQVKFHPVIVRSTEFAGAATAELPALQAVAKALVEPTAMQNVTMAAVSQASDRLLLAVMIGF